MSNEHYAIRKDWYESLAFRTLTPTARHIAIDMLRCYLKVSSFDTKSIQGTGFRYCFSDCTVPTSRKSFYEATQAIVDERGFFEYEPELHMQTILYHTQITQYIL